MNDSDGSELMNTGHGFGLMMDYDEGSRLIDGVDGLRPMDDDLLD